MKTYAKMFRPYIVSLLLALGLLYALSILLPGRLFYMAGGVLLGASVLFSVVYTVVFQRRLRRFSIDLSGLLSSTQTEALVHFPMPVIIVLDNGEILWYNDRCRQTVLQSDDLHGMNISEVFTGLVFQSGQPQQEMQLSYKKNRYTAFAVRTVQNETAVHIIYLVDDTELKEYKERYLRTRATVLIITIDNYEELLQNARESGRAQALPEVDYAITSYLKEYGALLCKIEQNKYYAVVEESAMQQIISGRFSLLDNVRKIEVAQRIPATLSIGVGRHANSLAEAEEMARQALDMSLGRGGDQAAIKTSAGYEFYGGVSKGIEKRTKVKSRIIATALAELISSASNVIIMGHRFADLDCVGAALGVYRAARLLGRNAAIAINKQKNLAKPLIDKLQAENYGDAFHEPEELLEHIDKDTLLIIVDVHAKHFIESEELYRRCRSVVVIDHHRKMVDYIDNTVIFYHEPYASSASEMVAELIPYLGLQKNLGRPEAEALLAGIMLDTKNFVVKAGVRTFEAAAYLKRLGADTVEVRKLFASPMESYQKKAKLVSSATAYRRCAIAFSQGAVEDIKLIAPQAADELLSISEVDASFVVFENGSQVEVSARSMGALNVQLIMEKLGGGGHLNMAAAQFPGAEIDDVHQQLLGAIDEYYETLNQK
ncbi:MAG: RNA/single-stranded DNA exonuclease [Provencibacterium sp.]|jgi:c-di-AMP phosphodiesterase-like protein|nr:RNA/single-stranded DNA exonuclease [Provencibacterium sp.]